MSAHAMIAAAPTASPANAPTLAHSHDPRQVEEIAGYLATTYLQTVLRGVPEQRVPQWAEMVRDPSKAAQVEAWRTLAVASLNTFADLRRRVRAARDQAAGARHVAADWKTAAILLSEAVYPYRKQSVAIDMAVARVERLRQEKGGTP